MATTGGAAAGAGAGPKQPELGALAQDRLPWEEKLAALMPGGREDIPYLAKSSKLLYKAGWRDKPSSTHPESDYTYYSPEGDRKRLLPLALRRGLEVFETRPEWLAYIFERMNSYFDAKECRPARASFADVLTHVACTASSAVVMAGVPQQNRTKNKVMWPARLATAEEARAYRIEHGLPLTEPRNQSENTTIIVVVLLCWGTHHVLHAVQRQYCRRVTPEEIETMLALWMNGAPPAETQQRHTGLTLGRELKDTQLSVEFVAGLAYAAAFARLAVRKYGAEAGGGLVSTQRMIRNAEVEGVAVPTFSTAELDDPWAALAAREGVVGLGAVVDRGRDGGDPKRLFPELQPCEQCVTDGGAGTCEGPDIMARALRYLQQERGHIFTAPVVAAAGRRRLWEDGGGGAGGGGGLLPSASSGNTADGSGGGGNGSQQPAQKRARLTPTDGIGYYPRTPSASGALIEPLPQQDAASLTVKEDGGHENGQNGAAGAPAMEADAEAEEEQEDVGAMAREFREAWSTLLGQAVLTGAWPGEGQEPLAVRAVEGAVAPLLAGAEKGDDGGEGDGSVEGLMATVGDLEWAHKVVAAGMGALSDAVRGAVERKWAEVEGLQVECWGVVALTPLARDPVLVGMVAARRPGWEAAAVEALGALVGKEKEGQEGSEENKERGPSPPVPAVEAAATNGGPGGVVEGKEGSRSPSASPPLEGEQPAADAAPAPAPVVEMPAAISDPMAAALARLKPLANKLANARSLLEAGRAQAEDAAKAAWDRWGCLRWGLLAAARRRCPGLGGVTGGGKTLLLYDARCAHHKVPEAHVEQPGRFLEASGAMRALARDHPGRYVLRTQIGDAYFPLWRGAAEGYAPEVLRAHTVSHLDALRLRCQAAGSTITRISADPHPHQHGKPAALTALAVAAAAARPQRRASSTALGGLSLSASASSAAAASIPSPGHHYHGADAGSAWGAGGGGQSAGVMDGDTFGTRASFIASSVGFAGALQAVDEVVSGRARNAFVACRPPGHHAGRNGKPALPTDASVQARDVGWGFCFLNYVAGAALHAVERWGLSRVTVVDFDLHHGNGTEEILTAQRATSFQFISLHAANIFPHTGGTPDPSRYPHLVNIPIEAPLTPAKYRKAWAQVDAAVDAFAPDLILLSAGYDAHVNDPIGARAFVGKLAPAGRLSSEDFHDFVARVRNLANRHCLGRMVGVMEGGYCCRPPEEGATAAAGAVGDRCGGGESDQECLGDDVKDETIQHCVAATCRALAGL